MDRRGWPITSRPSYWQSRRRTLRATADSTGHLTDDHHAVATDAHVGRDIPGDARDAMVGLKWEPTRWTFGCLVDRYGGETI